MTENDMQHGIDWDGETNLAGWWASEKFDGCRAYWDGTTLWSRGGIAIRLPDDWRNTLPADIPLDGEVYAGPGGRSRCMAAVRWGRFAPGMTFRVFDQTAARPGVRWPVRIAEIGAVLAPESEIVRPVEVSGKWTAPRPP